MTGTPRASNTRPVSKFSGMQSEIINGEESESPKHATRLNSSRVWFFPSPGGCSRCGLSKARGGNRPAAVPQLFQGLQLFRKRKRRQPLPPLFFVHVISPDTCA